MTQRDELRPDEARAALESVETMRRAGLRSASATHPAMLALAAALAFAFCAAPPFLEERGRSFSSLLLLAILYLPMLFYWGQRARPRIGRSDVPVVLMMLAFLLAMIMIRELGGYAYRQGHNVAPFIAGAVASVVTMLALHFTGKRTIEALAEQDREAIAQGGSERPNHWYVVMALAASAFAPASWGGALPPFSVLVMYGLLIVLFGFRAGMPGWPRRPMAEEWIAFALYAAINLGILLLVRQEIIGPSAAWFLIASLSLTAFLACYGLARRRLLAAGGENA